jgi:hypothetical protein
MSVQDEIERATELGQRLEDLIVNKQQLVHRGERELLLLGYWSLIFDLDKGMLSLIRSKFYGAAFALLRPIVETLVRSHVAIMCSDEDFAELQNDTYKTDFSRIGAQIDDHFHLRLRADQPGLMQKLLNKRLALHSYTHAGICQLARRFEGHDVGPNYKDGETIEAIHAGASAVFMVTNLLTRVYDLERESESASALYLEWGATQ